MKYLQVQLPSGSWRYITDIKENDFSFSIYPSTKVKPSFVNLTKAAKIISDAKSIHAVSVRINRG